MTSKSRNLIFLVLLAFLFVEVLIVFPHQVDKTAEDEPAESGEANGESRSGPMEQKAAGVHLVESQGSRRDWELFARQAEGNQTQSWRLQGVKVLFYNQERVEFTVTGDEGSIDAKSRNMQIRGNVETLSANGYRFFTQDVKYDAKARLISSPTRVRMSAPADRSGGSLTLSGGRMQADVARSRMRIFSNVVAEKKMSDGKNLTLKAESAEFSGKNRQADFRGKVVIRYGESVIEGPEAQFLASSAGDFLSRIRVGGGIKVTDSDKFATSEKLDLDLLVNQFTLDGQPKVYQGQDQLAGERIIFLDGGKKVKVESVRMKTRKEGP